MCFTMKNKVLTLGAYDMRKNNAFVSSWISEIEYKITHWSLHHSFTYPQLYLQIIISKSWFNKINLVPYSLVTFYATLHYYYVNQGFKLAFKCLLNIVWTAWLVELKCMVAEIMETPVSTSFVRALIYIHWDNFYIVLEGKCFWNQVSTDALHNL